MAYIERMKQEYSDLKEKVEKIEAFVCDTTFESLSKEDQELLLAQGNAMGAYLLILLLRLSKKGVNFA